MFCGSCGAKNSENSCFCTKCGARLEPIESNIGEKKQDVLGYAETSTENGIFWQAMKNKKLIGVVLVIVAVIVIALFITRGAGSSLLGTWEERSFTTVYGTDVYEAGEGDEFTLGKDGVIIDADSFLGYEFAYYVPVDVISWKAEGDTLIFYTEYGDVQYVPYKLSGKTLTLYFSDERSAVLQKIK